MRGGSKSIPRKNIRRIAGKPLFFWSISAAIDSGAFSEIWVSTDDQEISDLVRSHFPDVKVLDRPAELADDQASTESVMLHFAEHVSFDVLGLIQVTSPQVTAADFSAAKAAFETQGADSLLTAVESRRFFWRENGEAINYDPSKRPRRQDFEPWLMENGAFYFTRKELLLNEKCRLGGKSIIHKMPESSAYEIDDPSDWDIVESQLVRQKKRVCLQNISWIAVDVDGTLTDGKMIYSENGEFAKSFNTRDWHGLVVLEREFGTKIVVITRESSRVVDARMKKLGAEHYFKGIKDKKSFLSEWIPEMGWDFSQGCFIGDDENDLGPMELVAFSACPVDAVARVQREVDFVSANKGGDGAVREVCEMILEAKRSQRDEVSG